MKSKIEMHLIVRKPSLSSDNTVVIQTFKDWFDFADFLKQANEKRQWVEIYEWHYIPNKPMTWK